MKYAKILLFCAVTLISVSIGYFLGQFATMISAKTETEINKNSKNDDLLKKIKEEKISEIKTWEDDGESFYGIIRRVEEPPFDDSDFKSSDKFTIYNKTGKIVYQTKDFGIKNIQSVRLTNPSSWEIMFETDGGGTDNFLKIIDYKDGKFVEIIDESETQYRGGYFDLIQYRNGMKSPYFKPSQLIVTQQIGGIDENPSAAVFRMKDNKLQKVGSIEMQKLGDFIEKQIAENNK